MQMQGQQEEGAAAPAKAMCPRCTERPPKDGGALCEPCVAEEAAEALAGEKDASTAREARKDQTQPGKKKEKAKPAAAAGEQQQLGTGAEKQKAEPEKEKPAAAKPPASLGPGISMGRKDKRPRIVLYGPGGVGKTTIGCEAEDVIVIPCEVGSEGFDVARFDELEQGEGKPPGPPRNFDQVIWCLRWLLTTTHDRKWVLLDGAGSLERFIFATVVADHNSSAHKKGDAKNINEVGGGFKNGQDNAIDKWRIILGLLDRLREQKNIGTIFTLHALVRTFRNPDGEDFDRYQMKLDERGSGLLYEWADLVLFANFLSQTKKAGRGRAKGIGGRERMLFSERTDAYDAKARAPYSLPARLRMPEGQSFAALQHEIEIRKHPDLIVLAINRALEVLAAAKVTVPVKGAGEQPIEKLVLEELAKKPSPERLASMKNRLEARVDALEEQREAEAEAAAQAGPPAE